MLPLLLSIALPGMAQLSGRTAERLRCASEDGHWTHCPAENPDALTLVRQLSRSPCIRNESWGRDAQGIWVSRGCRAEFALPLVPEDEDEVGPQRQSIRCQSRRGQVMRCPLPRIVNHEVRLVRQLSRPACVLGESWGFDPGGVWVSRGCHAEFEALVMPGERAPRRRPPPPDADLGVIEGQALRCESHEGQPAECVLRSGPVRRVVLVQQISRAPCEEGRSWGWQNERVWVRDGCRAEFVAW